MITRLNNGAGVSRYLRLYSVLSQALAEGRIGAGEALPSEPRLMREYGVSRSTVRRALARLEAEDRIVRKRGSGTYARRPAQAAAPTGLTPPPDGTAGLPEITSHRTLTFEPVPTPEFLKSEHKEFGATTLLIRRVGCVRRDAVVLEAAYIPDPIGAQLTRRRLGSDGRDVLSLLEALGHSSASLEREFAALPADPLTANSLGSVVSTPILNIRTIARDSRHRVLAYINLSYRPDRYEARIDIELDAPRRNRVKKRPGERAP